jgi:DNA-directed RNA polymerase specialized sigma24 family protein
MSNPENSSDDLIERFKAGDEDAANELLGKYFERTVWAAKKRISKRRLRGVGSEDIAVSVFESLWKKADKKQFSDDDLSQPDEFWRLLCTMVRFKTEVHLRRENADKRGGGAVRGESIFDNPGDESTAGIAGISDGEMTGPEQVAFKDQHEMMMRVLEDAILQEIVTMRMEEFKVAEIASHFDRSKRWVKRKLALIRDIWQRELDRSDP